MAIDAVESVDVSVGGNAISCGTSVALGNIAWGNVAWGNVALKNRQTKLGFKRRGRRR